LRVGFDALEVSDLDPILARLASSSRAVRRVAVLDLIRLAAIERRAAAALVSHLPHEHDEKSALAIIRHLAERGDDACRAVLWELYQQQETPARVAHAAIMAHDRLLAGSARSGLPLECARGDQHDPAQQGHSPRPDSTNSGTVDAPSPPGAGGALGG
jgi:hypothetical protein